MPQTYTTKGKLQQLWTGEDTFATTLLILFTDIYGSADGEAYAWDPRAIKLSVEDDFDLTLPQANHDRLMTAIALLKSDSFFNSLPDFVAFCNILSGDTYDPRTWDPADSSEIAWGITEALLISPPENDEPFSEDVCAYIGMILDTEGIMTPPDILRIALRGQQNLAATVQADFADDPDMFGAVYQFETMKTAQINRTVRDNLRKLATQIQDLPLNTGDTRAAVTRMLEGLR
jgi:hypothetical protein